MNIQIVDDRYVKLPKLGLVKCKVSKQIKGKILSATITKKTSGKYFVSLCCRVDDIDKAPSTGKSIGVDIGIKDLVVTSEGTKYENAKYLRKSEKKLARAQRSLSRKPRGSKNYHKAQLKVALIHERVQNQRLDAIHKCTTDLVRKYDIICIEDLATSNLVKNHKLAKSICDASFGEIKRQLQYKCEWHGRQLVVVDRFYPSSQLCSCCGNKWSGTKDLKVRHWTCPACSTKLDRDVNAAINIKNEGLHILASA